MQRGGDLAKVARRDCLRDRCPQLDTVTVDTDPDMESVARMFFGWQSDARMQVSLDGAEGWFREAAARGERRDLVIWDCYSRHGMCTKTDLRAAGLTPESP